MKLFVILFTICLSSIFAAEDSAWIQLFRPDDVNLSDWTPKFMNANLGVNQNNAFRYAAKGTDSASPGAGPRLEVVLTKKWNDGSSTYGHLFYKTPFSYYLVRAQFHFLDTTSQFQEKGGWTIQNNGLMLHSEDPKQMSYGQDFPRSIENQLLGYYNEADQPPPNATSSNVCLQPNSTIKYGNEVLNNSSHGNCTRAKFHSLSYVKKFSPIVWQYSLSKVLADSSMTFYVRNRPDTAWDSVMHFTELKFGDGSPNKQGFIAIQAEGTSTEFAKIELLNLVGCMDKNSQSYRTYFVKHDATKCSAVGIKEKLETKNQITLSGTEIFSNSEIEKVEIYNLKGEHLKSIKGNNRNKINLDGFESGLNFAEVYTKNNIQKIKINFLSLN